MGGESAPVRQEDLALEVRRLDPGHHVYISLDYDTRTFYIPALHLRL